MIETASAAPDKRNVRHTLLPKVPESDFRIRFILVYPVLVPRYCGKVFLQPLLVE